MTGRRVDLWCAIALAAIAVLPGRAVGQQGRGPLAGMPAGAGSLFDS